MDPWSQHRFTRERKVVSLFQSRFQKTRDVQRAPSNTSSTTSNPENLLVNGPNKGRNFHCAESSPAAFVFTRPRISLIMTSVYEPARLAADRACSGLGTWQNMGFLLNYMCLFLFVGLILKVMSYMFECTRLVEITI